MSLHDEIKTCFLGMNSDRKDHIDYESLMWHNPWRSMWITTMLNNTSRMEDLGQDDVILTRAMLNVFLSQVISNIQNSEPPLDAETHRAVVALTDMPLNMMSILAYDNTSYLVDALNNLAGARDDLETSAEAHRFFKTTMAAFPDYFSRGVKPRDIHMTPGFNNQISNGLSMMMKTRSEYISERATSDFRDVFIGSDFNKNPLILKIMMGTRGMVLDGISSESKHPEPLQKLLFDVFKHVLETPNSQRVIKSDFIEQPLNPSSAESNFIRTTLNENKMERLINEFIHGQPASCDKIDQQRQFMFFMNIEHALLTRKRQRGHDLKIDQLTRKRQRGHDLKMDQQELAAFVTAIENRLPALTDVGTLVTQRLEKYIKKSAPVAITAKTADGKKQNSGELFTWAFNEEDMQVIEPLLKEPDGRMALAAIIRDHDSLSPTKMLRAVTLWSKHEVKEISDIDVANCLVNFFAKRVAKNGFSMSDLDVLPNRDNLKLENHSHQGYVLWLYRNFKKKHRKLFSQFGLALALTVPELDFMRPGNKLISQLSFWMPEKTLSNIIGKISEASKPEKFHELWVNELFPGKGHHCTALCKLMVNNNSLEDTFRTVQAFANTTPLKVSTKPIEIDHAFDFLQPSQ